MDPTQTSRRPGDLSQILDSEKITRRIWVDSELGDILRHQLNTPMGCDLESIGENLPPKLRGIGRSEQLLLQSFGQLLRHPAPPLDLLSITKDFAKHHFLHSNSPLPKEIARVLYISCIAAALVKCHARITKLDDAHIRAGIEWGLNQPWLDADTRDLLQAGLRALGQAEAPSR